MAESGSEELGLQARDRVGRQLSERHVAESRRDVAVVVARVVAPCLRGEQRRVRVDPCPGDVGVERLRAGVEERQGAGAASATAVGVEVERVAAAREGARAVASVLAPSHSPYDLAILALDLLDAHGLWAAARTIQLLGGERGNQPPAAARWSSVSRAVRSGP